MGQIRAGRVICSDKNPTAASFYREALTFGVLATRLRSDDSAQ